VRDLRDSGVEVIWRARGRNQDLDDGALAFEHRAPVRPAAARHILRGEGSIDRVRRRDPGEADFDVGIHALDRQADAKRARARQYDHRAARHETIDDNVALPEAAV
jgi:hypothetical protein